MKLLKFVFMGVLFASTPLVLSACEQETQTEANIEEIENSVDEMGDSMEQSIEEIADEVEGASE